MKRALFNCHGRKARKGEYSGKQGLKVSQKHSHEADNVGSEAHFNILDLPYAKVLTIMLHRPYQFI